MVSPDGPILKPAAAVENNFVSDFHMLLKDVGDQAGEPASSGVRALTDFGEAVGFGNIGSTPDDPLSSVLGSPEAILNGEGGQAICNILDEADNMPAAAGDFANQVVDAVNLRDPLNTGLINDIAGDLGNGPLIDAGLLDLNGNGEPGGLVGAVVNTGFSQPGALIGLDVSGDGQPSQSHDLVEIDAGPQGNTRVGSLNVLSEPDQGSSHTAEAHIVNVGSDGPRLFDADVFTDSDFMTIPGLNGTGGGTQTADLLASCLGTGGNGIDVGGLQQLASGCDPLGATDPLAALQMFHSSPWDHGLLAA
jgi:hypothetical protein